MSLKKQLNNLIQEKGFLSYRELKDFCGQEIKMSVAERRLRLSESPDVEVVIKDGSIHGYRWKGAPKTKLVYEYDRVNNKVLVYLR